MDRDAIAGYSHTLSHTHTLTRTHRHTDSKSNRGSKVGKGEDETRRDERRMDAMGWETNEGESLFRAQKPKGTVDLQGAG